MNLPGHRIAACLGKAALKPHALQTLRDRLASPNRAKRLECVRFIGAFRPARDGPRSRVPMHAKNRKGTRPGHRIAARLGKAALKTHALQTLRDRRASPNRAKRLECVRFIGAFRPARDGPRFRVPMHSKKRKQAFHEPPVWSSGFNRSEPSEGGTPYRWHDPAGFSVPMPVACGRASLSVAR
jgi:hypothetical protein